MNYDVIIVASGRGQRANLGYNKAFYRTKDGRTVLECAASLFMEDDDCKNIIVVTNKEYLDQVFKHDKITITLGGQARRDSVENGLDKVSSEYVLVHDAARPFLIEKSLQDLKKKVIKTDACILARKATDTIKVVVGKKVIKTLDRNTIYMAETPQAFKTQLLKKCYRESDVVFTDEASLLESLGYEVSIVEDKFDNKKLTNEADFIGL